MDEDSLLGRLKRYAEVSGSLPQIAAKLAKYHYLPDSAAASADDVRALVGELKGPLMKVAQLLSGVPGLLPDNLAEALRQLQSCAPAMGAPFVRRRMRGELGPDWESQFASFEITACAAASLGQVHQAVLPDGRQVACKLQYPDMPAIVKADLAQVKLCLGLLDRYSGALRSDATYQEIEERLLEELDYTREAQHIALYRYIHRESPYVTLPEVVPDLSTNRLLTMRWLPGRGLMDCRESPQEARNTIARNLFHAWYMPFYHYGVIHGDPHFGNYKIGEAHEIQLLDFGCIRQFPPVFVEGVVDLYQALSTNDRDLAAHAYEKWGFSQISNELMDVLNQWAHVLYGPLMDDRVRPIDLESSSATARQVASQVYEKLKAMGGVSPPREFVFMDRAAVGLGSAFLQLGAQVNWYQEIQSIVQGYSAAGLARNQVQAWEASGLSLL